MHREVIFISLNTLTKLIAGDSAYVEGVEGVYLLEPKGYGGRDVFDAYTAGIHIRKQGEASCLSSKDIGKS